MRQRDIKKYKDSDKTELQFYAVRDDKSRIHCASLFDDEPNLNWTMNAVDEPRKDSHGIVRSYVWAQIVREAKPGNPFFAETKSRRFEGMRMDIWKFDREGKPTEIVPFNQYKYYETGYMPYKYREVLGTWEQYVEAYGENIAKDWDYQESRRKQIADAKEREERTKARQETMAPLLKSIFGVDVLPDQIPRWIISSDQKRFDALKDRLTEILKLTEARPLPQIPPRDFLQGA